MQMAQFLSAIIPPSLLITLVLFKESPLNFACTYFSNWQSMLIIALRLRAKKQSFFPSAIICSFSCVRVEGYMDANGFILLHLQYESVLKNIVVA